MFTNQCIGCKGTVELACQYCKKCYQKAIDDMSKTKKRMQICWCGAVDERLHNFYLDKLGKK